MIIGTAYTEGYPYAAAFLASLDEHDYDYERWIVGRDIPSPPETRTDMLQHGAFLGGLTVLLGDDPIIVFADADMICQRVMNADEVAFLFRLGPLDVALGINKERGETLADEAAYLKMKVPSWTIDALFPGWRELPAWNTGFVAALYSTYSRLYDMARALLPAAESCFGHYAAMQWCICYCVGKWLRHVPLPESICLHGCWGPPQGFSFDGQGRALFNGGLVAFRHAINVNPQKCVAWHG